MASTFVQKNLRLKITWCIPLAVLLLVPSKRILSQNCSSQFEVHAGADIDVCETGAVVLDGYVGGDANRITWKGGKGTFSPGRHALNAEYTPASSEIGDTVLLVLEADNPDLKNCPPVHDEEKIIVNSQPRPHAGENQHTCGQEKVMLHGIVEGKAKEMIWKTSGTGTFDDIHLLNATYFPSAGDMKKRGCSLYLVAKSYGYCFPDSDALSLAIDPAPIFTTAEDVKAKPGEPVSLSIQMNGLRGKMEWNTQGTGRFTHVDQEETEYIFSSSDLKNQKVIISVTVHSSEGSCATTKNIMLHTGEAKTN